MEFKIDYGCERGYLYYQITCVCSHKNPKDRSVCTGCGRQYFNVWAKKDDVVVADPNFIEEEKHEPQS